VRSSGDELPLLLLVDVEGSQALDVVDRADVRPPAVPGCRRSGFLRTQSTQHKREKHAGSTAGRKTAGNLAPAAASGEYGGAGFSPAPTCPTTSF
jgi:hypothetical protein